MISSSFAVFALLSKVKSAALQKMKPGLLIQQNPTMFFLASPSSHFSTKHKWTVSFSQFCNHLHIKMLQLVFLGPGSWTLILKHACMYGACVYDAANFDPDEPTNKAILGVWYRYQQHVLENIDIDIDEYRCIFALRCKKYGKIFHKYLCIAKNSWNFFTNICRIVCGAKILRKKREKTSYFGPHPSGFD